MKGQQIFSIFIAVLLIASIVGVTAFYSFPDQDNGNNDGDGLTDLPPTAIEFVAEDVEAVVFQLLPSIHIVAETVKTDVIALNTSIYSIEGIKRVNGSFQQWSYTNLGTGFIYIADISFDADLNSAFILEALANETSLQYVEGRNYALVELPKKVSMHSADEVLNLSREYEFSENITEAMVGFGSIEEDVLKVELSATFIGEQATNILASESKNVTATPEEKNVLLSAPVAELEETLLFNAEVKRSSLENLDSLEQDINAVNGILNAQVFVPGIVAKINISGTGALEEQTLSNFESFLNDLNAENVSLENAPLSGFVLFNSKISSQDFLEKLSAIKAEAAGFEIDTLIEEETGFLSGQAALASVNSGPQGSTITALLEAKGIEADIKQPANLTLFEISDSEGNTYAVPTGSIAAMLSSGHSLGEDVEVEVGFVIVRNLFNSAFAEEK